MTAVRENGATSGVGVLATFAYDDLGRRTGLTRGNGTVTSYAFDAVSRLASLDENFTGTANDQSATFAYTPASQIASLSKTNDLFAWTGHGSGTTAWVANGLNQLASIGGAATAHDARGNLTTDPANGKGYSYSSENLLTGATGGMAASLTYDPGIRLFQLTGAATTRFAYDGLDLIAEYDGAGAVLKRYVHGPGSDEPLVEYDGGGTSTKHWLHADERGSIIAQSDGSGAVTQINRYDEYGKPQSTNAGRFQYTGQTWLPEVGAYYYKARSYEPVIGRFLQTDPIGVAGGMNTYAYAGDDPVNFVDPLGLNVNSIASAVACEHSLEAIIVCGDRPSCSAQCIEETNNWIDSFLWASAMGGVEGVAQSGNTVEEARNCAGRARVLGGNPRTIGRIGGFGVPVRGGSAAIIPNQFGTRRVVNSNRENFSATVNGRPLFNGATDVVGGRSPIRGVPVRDALQQLNPGELIIELPSGTDQGHQNVTVTVPDNMTCPAGTVGHG